jgi:hypothetical protein
MSAMAGNHNSEFGGMKYMDVVRYGTTAVYERLLPFLTDRGLGASH